MMYWLIQPLLPTVKSTMVNHLAQFILKGLFSLCSLSIQIRLIQLVKPEHLLNVVVCPAAVITSPDSVYATFNFRFIVKEGIFMENPLFTTIVSLICMT